LLPDSAVLQEAERADEQAARADVYALTVQLDRPAEARIERGDPGVVICDVAADGDFDLVVVGSHGHGVLKRLLIGSVSNHVLQHAPCPVLVVREHSSPEP